VPCHCTHVLRVLSLLQPAAVAYSILRMLICHQNHLHNTCCTELTVIFTSIALAVQLMSLLLLLCTLTYIRLNMFLLLLCILLSCRRCLCCVLLQQPEQPPHGCHQGRTGPGLPVGWVSAAAICAAAAAEEQSHVLAPMHPALQFPWHSLFEVQCIACKHGIDC
jgi:hypothetical protein